jgi:tetratricopeptide (TPR) repeat protein
MLLAVANSSRFGSGVQQKGLLRCCSLSLFREVENKRRPRLFMKHVPLALTAVTALLIEGTLPLASLDDRTFTLAQLDTYERGDYERVEVALEQVRDATAIGKALEAVTPTWIRSAARDAETRRRRLVAATLALELARVVIRGSQSESLRPVAGPIIEVGCRLLRSVSPRPEELVWHLAALALVERSYDAYFLTGYVDPGMSPQTVAAIRARHGDAANHLGHARDRFPEEPRLQLIQVVAREIHEVGGHWGWLSRPVSPPPDAVPTIRDVMRSYLGLADTAPLRAEALLRAGVMAFRLGDYSEAMKRFAAVDSATEEKAILYLARLLNGKSLERTGRIPEAESAYRDALRVVPTGQAAASALAALLFKSDRRAEIESLLRTATMEASTLADPWRDYSCGSCRHWPALILQLRQSISGMR